MYLQNNNNYYIHSNFIKSKANSLGSSFFYSGSELVFLFAEFIY